MKFRLVLPLLVAVGVATLLFLPADAFAQTLELDALDKTCQATELKNCKVLGSGRYNIDWGDEEGAPMLAWQTQSGFTEEDGVLGGFALFVHDSGTWRLLDSGWDGARFEAPRLGQDGSVLHLPGYSGGTGAYNVDRLYVWNDSGDQPVWQNIDLDHWRQDIDTLLPEGLEIWKGVDYDFSDWFYGDSNARTPLWRADDGNCCPSGGMAIIHFDLDMDAGRLIATGIDHIPPQE
ncbi:MAG: hypothetical protein ABS75_25370 [Pelagibacterium sp. SCN 63-23]|nr:MAG: hypothetical protein ABS75_25370 [Pelagibacterium sp. SCN 63-23]